MPVTPQWTMLSTLVPPLLFFYHDHRVCVCTCPLGGATGSAATPRREETVSCHARPCMLAPSIPVTSQMPNGRSWRRYCQRQHGVVAHAPGRCGSSLTRCSTSYARAAPGAICRGSIHPGKRPIRSFASGACAGCGSASTRCCAARFASGPPRQPLDGDHGQPECENHGRIGRYQRL
jgi:hypothetical protein